MKKKRRKVKKNIFSPAIFLSFVIVALLLIIFLEYIEFNKTGKSFIFSRFLGNRSPGNYALKFNKDLFDILEKDEYLFDYYHDTRGKYHFKIDVTKKRFKNLKNNIKKLLKKYGFKLIPVEVKREQAETIFFFKTVHAGKLFHYLLLSRGETDDRGEIKPLEKSAGPRIAIIIDDIGAHQLGAFDLKKLRIPISASVLPFSPRAFEESRWLHEYGLEELIHLPMQSKRDKNNGHSLKNTIRLGSDDRYIEDLIKRAKKIVPYARGINNHQGSLVTSDKSLMKRIIRIIKKEGLFFVDSRTDFDSIAYKVARMVGIKSGKRDVFLDHVQSYDHSIFQIKRLVRIAQKNGSAIAIGHPFKTTLQAIKDSISFIKSQKVNIVFVSELLN